MKPVIPIIAGPTAVGKTSLSIALAKRMDAEIVSADSRQIYAPFRIGTARPTPDEMSGVAHHLMGDWPLDEPYSAGIFADKARAVIPDIQARGKRVVVVGGSTLYVEALLNGLSDIPEVDPSVREKLNHEVEAGHLLTLYKELLHGDPAFAATLDATKSQRIVRGLEILRGTGRPLSTFHTPPPLPDQRFHLVILHADRKQLYERIDVRVERMLAEGLLEECRAALDAFPDTGLNAWRTIGYQELLPFLDGKTSLEGAVTAIKRNSRRYAKRQLTWYRRYPQATWLDLDTEGVEVCADRLAEAFRAP